ncbi:glycosyl transferase [Pseudofrankia inefficax]|uniref:Glycosyl transferase, family 4, conserved region n=1 Tax=Pseudofrankia inefficax (strain DSM 45817 / CECT 9037 / DDB 130130 / EuI1c) TaxID=298654 RepID=E3IZ12_PSEI1|nr:glycosyl transferase [Pseudofrankia inefficax]ADP80295.1 Glycosyl transferase, family 4, conserved region [Pseudofrankia inefficax]
MVGAGFAACVVTLAATPLVIAYMRRLSVLDVANERTLHTRPTPRGGGAAVVLGLFSGVVFTVLTSGRASAPDLLPMTLAVTLFGLLGLAEDVGGDIGGIAPLRRLALQALAAAALTAMTVVSVAIGAGRPGLGMVAAAVVIGPVWITGFVNAFNFMDGVNGISATQATVAGVGYALVGTVHHSPPLVAGGTVLAGAALGFAPFNMPRALVFLGDVGSYAIGGAIAALALQAAVSGVPVEAVAAPVVLYLADTATTLVRRIRTGERWYLPHRGHAYQRLVTAGWSHTTVAGYTGVLAAFCAGLGLVSATTVAVPVRVCADLMICFLVARYLGAPRRVATRRGGVEAPGRTPSPAPADRLATSPADRSPDGAAGEPAGETADATLTVPAQRAPAERAAGTVKQ